MKKCTKCGEEKELSMFPKQENRCKKCRQEYYYVWIKKNPEKNTAYCLKWQRENKEKWNKTQMDGYYRNHEHRIAQSKVYLKKYQEEIKEKYGISRTTFYRNGGAKVYNELLKNWQCSRCGKVEDINVHHKDNQGRRNKRLGLKPNNSINNLEVLCRACHSSHHQKEKTYGIKSKGGVK